MKLAFQIAVRFLKSSKGQTILIALGIAVGISVQIFIGSLIQGLQEGLIDKTIGNSPQITIKSDHEDRLLVNFKNIIDKAKYSDERIINISAVSDNPALIKDNDKTYSVLIRGMDINASDKIYNIKSRIIEGREANSVDEVIVGINLKEELKVDIGDSLQVITNSGEINSLIITGFFDLKVANLNKSWLITTLQTSDKIFSLNNRVTGIEMQVKDVFKADEIALGLDSIFDNSFRITNWKAENQELLSGLSGQSISSIMIQVFVLIAVVLGIASVLAITVLQKSKQLGILKAMGIKDRTASMVFIFEGLILGFLGAILGVTIGLLLGYVFTKFALNPDGSPIVALNANYGFIAFSAVTAITVSTIAALIPAWRSSKLNPIEVIKNG
ncbi:ABC transporter permease [Alkaliphilus serpentinus]|uniref:ABC transporter permease n=1 Tax=Alkaliphilus serpentinus TaxID=1482731 RepID=A0A833HLA3_9FIRM|nr:FtsX-like permease family protein [Alkaliphilus serpentinus]KAB3525517.1 ABC transporter permease [Alkaliphilus serpentinus]